MAILEFEFKATGLSGLTNNLNNLQNQLNNINRNSSININAGNSSRNLSVASDSILGLRNRLNELLRTYGSLSEAQRNNSRVQNNLVPEINRLREAVTQANREYDNLRRGSGRPIPSDSIVGMRTRLNELRAVYDRLSESQRNSGRVQSNLVGEINRLNTAVSRAEQSTGRFQRNVGNYASGMSGANGVTMEFNRIIQDAPFGMMGIGNNIQQLAANWQNYTQQARAAAAANGTVVTNASLMRGALSALISPANLLTLGIAAITSAWTFYTMQQQKANKANKEAKEATEDFRKSLDTLSRVQLEASTNANKDLTRLKMLSVVYKDNASSSKQRELALNGIVNLYKTYFPNLTLEQAKIEALSGKYAKLTEEILRTSRARGYEQILAEKQTDNINALAKQSSARNNINKAIDEYRREVEKGGKKLNKTNEELFSQFYDQLNTKGVKPLTEMPKNANSFIKASVGVYQAILKYNGLQRNSISTQQSYNEIFQQYLKDVKEGKISIEEFNTKLEEAKGSDSLGNSLKNISEKAKEAIDYLKELQNISGVSEKDFAMVGKVGIDAQISSLAFDFNDKIKQIEDFQQKVLNDTTLTESKRAQIIAETNKTIQYLMGEASANMKDVIAKNIEALDKMQVKAVKTIKDVEIVESPKQKQGRNREDDRDWKEYANILNQSVNSIFTNLKSNIDEFGLKAESVFYSLGETVGDMLKQIANKNTAKFMESITKDAKSFSDLKDNWKNTSSQDKWSAGLGMAGSLVSSMAPKSSVGGQAIGGALSGAAAGTAIMPGIGTAIGAGVGFLAGALSGAKNKRQEKIIQEQLEEQKKANRLLERMSALTYASQIIGQKTEYGIVSGVRRNEFGQIVSVVQGQDIIMVADRANNQKQR